MPARCLEEPRNGTRNNFAERQSARCRIAAQIAHDAAGDLQRDWHSGFCNRDEMADRRRLLEVAISLPARQSKTPFPIINSALKLEVIFCIQGAATPTACQYLHEPVPEALASKRM